VKKNNELRQRQSLIRADAYATGEEEKKKPEKTRGDVAGNVFHSTYSKRGGREGREMTALQVSGGPNEKLGQVKKNVRPRSRPVRRDIVRRSPGRHQALEKFTGDFRERKGEKVLRTKIKVE